MEECRPNPETWSMELKLHFFVVCKREKDGHEEETCSFLKTEFSENEGLFCVTSLCEMFVFLLSLHWYLPDNYDCIKLLYWLIVDLHICIMTWGVLAGLNPRSLPQVGIEVFNVLPWTTTNPCRPVDVIIYAPAEMTVFCLIVSCLPSPCCQLKGPGDYFRCLAHSFAQNLSLLVSKNRTVLYSFSEMIKGDICTCCFAMRDSILEVTAVLKTQVHLYSCFVNFTSAHWTKTTAYLYNCVVVMDNKSLF